MRFKAIHYLQYRENVHCILPPLILRLYTGCRFDQTGKNRFWSIRNSGEILDKLKARDFNATSLSTYDFSTLYTTLPHNLIKDKLIDLIERTFQREGSPYLACSDRNAFLLQKNLKNIMHGRVKMYVMR